MTKSSKGAAVMERIILIDVKYLGVEMTEIYDRVEGESYGRLTNRLVAEFKQKQLEKALLSQAEFPDAVQNIVIWADKDRSKAGATAAKALAKKLTRKGISVFIFEPDAPIPDDQKGIDWLDVLKQFGASSFPNPYSTRKSL
jgi:hypothetical protein